MSEMFRMVPLVVDEEGEFVIESDGCPRSCVEAGELERDWCLACASECPDQCVAYGPEEVF